MSTHGGYIETPHDDYAVEPVPGIPAPLPEGERLIWQGSPSWRALAVRAFHIRKVAIYFAILALWRGASHKADGASTLDALSYALWMVPVAMLAIGILCLLAYAYGRTSIYTITSRRVLIRSGVALPITVNLPFKRIDGAGLRLYADGTGDLPLTLAKDDRIAILAIWPHMRPWRVNRPEPMLRAVPDASHVADILAAALSGARIPAPMAAQATAGSRTTGPAPADLRPAH
jgi:Bacterial PH domain